MDITLLTSAAQPTTEVLPALGLLAHRVTVAPCDIGQLLDRPLGNAMLLDARRDLGQARAFSRILRTLGSGVPVMAVLTEGGLVALSAEWDVDDVILDTAGPAELDARLRMAVVRQTVPEIEGSADVVRAGDLVIDETTYSAKLRNVALDLTYKEFELLKYLAQHPSRVFTRARLLQEVWGYDYFGGTRTVDVHVRRLRAKLGPDYETFIGTVRNVGYKFVQPNEAGTDATKSAPATAGHITTAGTPASSVR